MKLPRIMLAAPASGSGKTLITCGILQALVNRGYRVASFKCGPDYIDPMFHSRVIGTRSGNLDTFFTDYATTRYLFGEAASEADLSVIEGVMGYYDGMALDSERGSSYDVARTLKAPVILVVQCKGMALSVLPVIQGILGFRKDSNISGILLNRVSGMLYPKMKRMIETGLAQAGYPIPVIGYVPENPVFGLESRHLGLVTPQEIGEIRERLEEAGRILSETVELDCLLKIAAQFSGGMPEVWYSDKKAFYAGRAPRKHIPGILCVWRRTWNKGGARKPFWRVHASRFAAASRAGNFIPGLWRAAAPGALGRRCFPRANAGGGARHRAPGHALPRGFARGQFYFRSFSGRSLAQHSRGGLCRMVWR